MSFTSADVPDLADKTIIVTGANSGIGFEAARVFARQRADVILACRSLDRGQGAKTRILAESPGARIELLALDLGSLASVRQFAERVNASRSKLDVLVNNAGIMAIPRTLTEDGFEMQLGVNHFGHFALTGRLLPRLLAAHHARVVTVSSLASKLGRMRFDDLALEKNYHKWLAYGQSKLANLLFTFELARRFTAKSLATRSLACHPGYASTNLQFVGPEMEGSRAGVTLMRASNRLFGQSAEMGALPTLFAATSPAAQSGEFIGPQGLFGRAGSPGSLKAMSAAYDRTTMQKLWERSIELTGVDYSELA
jgi:NAD(P)-dependent dehydrogenase (short-subunit alcohol dehydrogenase family)